MPSSKIRLEQIENGRTLRQLVRWFKVAHLAMPPRANTLRTLRATSRRAAQRAGIGPQDIPRLIAEVRARRAKTTS